MSIIQGLRARVTGRRDDVLDDVQVSEMARDVLERRRELQQGWADRAALRSEVPAEKIADLVDWFGLLLETGHTLDEALDGVRFYARGAFGSIE